MQQCPFLIQEIKVSNTCRTHSEVPSVKENTFSAVSEIFGANSIIYFFQVLLGKITEFFSYAAQIQMS